ncbi:MAG: DUF2071 domain-containing protein [Thermonemataceae bacterium]|nr:DUF2071 domain-containing protein [Thermonemataceae bacterium]
MSFLKAEWRKLAIANYEVSSEVLQEFVPYGTRLDTWQGKNYVSLVGFMFMNTKVLGVKIPFHINFEEVNLRFYVKREENTVVKRGVVFIKEIVPKPAITWVANTLYKEHYQTMPMKHEWQHLENKLKISYDWQHKNSWYRFAVETENVAKPILTGSDTEFITEHYWGYAQTNSKKTNEYQVTHPRWLAYEVLNYDIKVDFGQLYGEKFAFLNQQKPASVMLAEGSEITVEPKKTIRM